MDVFIDAMVESTPYLLLAAAAAIAAIIDERNKWHEYELDRLRYSRRRMRAIRRLSE